MGGRFGKYGDTKRKTRIRQSEFAKKKNEKIKPNPRRLRRQEKKWANKYFQRINQPQSGEPDAAIRQKGTLGIASTDNISKGSKNFLTGAL